VKQELEKALLLKSRLLSNMTHEIRTPLNAILAYAELMQMQPKPEFTTHIIKACERLMSLVNDILDLSKVESGNMTVKLTYADVPTIVKETVDLLLHLAKAKHIIIDTNIQAGWPMVLMDDVKLCQILTNLISNAIKFTPSGGYVCINVDYAIENKKLNFTIMDTGIGIASQDYDNVFAEFIQVESSHPLNQQQGTGLGLNLSRKLARLLQGDIAFSSQVGIGSTFILTLPYYAV
jgi:two-component system, NarL family, sensor histidine kinase BarA